MFQLLLVPLIFAGLAAWRYRREQLRQVPQHLRRLWEKPEVRAGTLTAAFLLAGLGWFLRPAPRITIVQAPSPQAEGDAIVGGPPQPIPTEKLSSMGGYPRGSGGSPSSSPETRDRYWFGSFAGQDQLGGSSSSGPAPFPAEDDPGREGRAATLTLPDVAPESGSGPSGPFQIPAAPEGEFVGGIRLAKEEPPRDAGVPRYVEWLTHPRRPEPQAGLPAAREGLLWSVLAVPSTGPKPNARRVVLDPDGLRVYSGGHDANRPAMDAGTFVGQWHLADGSLIWAQRINADLDPAFNHENNAVSVYDAQPIQALARRPAPGKSPIHPIWVLSRLSGGIVGPLPTFPIADLEGGGKGAKQYLRGMCPAEDDVTKILNTMHLFQNGAHDYFDWKEYGPTFQFIQQMTGIDPKIRRALVGTPSDAVLQRETAIFTANRLEPRVRIWSLDEGRQLTSYFGHRKAVDLIRSRGRWLVTADADEAHHWTSERPRETHQATRLPAIPRTCIELTWGWDYALIGIEDGKLIIHDLRHQVPIGEPIQAHEGAVQDVAISRDWRRAVTIGADGMLKCWGLPEIDGPHRATTPPVLFGPIVEKEGGRYRASLEGRAVNLDDGGARPLREVFSLRQSHDLRLAHEAASLAARDAKAGKAEPPRPDDTR
ncbi:MAG: hypothetical protein AB7I30_01275 [Isosphaeraceae bacterium]